mgnify:CR=1 FL=1
MKYAKGLLFVATLIITSVMYAQPQGGGKQQGPPPIPNATQITEMVTELSKEISLTKQQTASVHTLYTAHFKEVKVKTSGNSRPKREDMETLKMNFEKKVKATLTIEQKKQYESYLKKMEQRHVPR